MKAIRPPRTFTKLAKSSSKAPKPRSKRLVATLRSEIQQLRTQIASLQVGRSNTSPKSSPMSSRRSSGRSHKSSPMSSTRSSPKSSPSPMRSSKSPKSPVFVPPPEWKRSNYRVPLNPRHVEWNTHGPGNLSVSEWHEHRKNPLWMKLAGFKSPAPVLMKRSSKHVKRERTWENNQLEKAFQDYYMNQQLQSLRSHGQMKSKGLREVAKPMNIV